MRSRPAFDRGVRPEWLDAALRLARRPSSTREVLDLLDVALRDDIPHREARSKTRTVLAHVWITPPESARDLIGWAIRCSPEIQDHRIMHLGALLATYPFFADACTHVGRQLALHRTVHTSDLRHRLRAKWGDRSTIDVSARRVIWTLRAFGTLTGKLGEANSDVGAVIEVPTNLQLWIVDVLLHARDIQEVDAREVGKAPELFMFSLPAGSLSTDGYPHLEHFNEGGGRSVLRRRMRDRPRNLQLGL